MSEALRTTGGEIAYRVPPRRPRGRRIARHAVGLIGFTTIVLLSFFLKADQQRVTTATGAALPDLCALRGWTGLPCPGCGLTRCFVHMSHGDIAAAWSVSPAGILFFALIVSQIPMQGIQLVRAVQRRPDLWIVRWTGPALVTVAALLIAQWLIRLA